MPRTHLYWIISVALLLCTMISGVSAHLVSCVQQPEMRSTASIGSKEQLRHEHHSPLPAVTAAHTLRISSGGYQKYSTDNGALRCKITSAFEVPAQVLSVLYYADQDQQEAVQGNRRWLTLRTLLI